MLKYFILGFIVSSSFFIRSQSDSMNGLKVGDKAPFFTANDYNGAIVDLSESIKEKKVVLVFYRGAWCPHCNKHMSQLQDSFKMIEAKGAIVIAVSPELDESIEKMVSKTDASFHIISDKGYVIMEKYGVSFKVNRTTLAKYKLIGVNLEKANGNTDYILPVPATIIINQNGVIDYIHFDENHKNNNVFIILNDCDTVL